MFINRSFNVKSVRATSFLAVLFSLSFYSESLAQTVVRGPDGVGQFTPSLSIPEFKIAPGVSCPTPSFSIVGFGGSASDYGNSQDYVTSGNYDARTHGGNDNYGVAVGFTMPLGASYAKWCRETAILRRNDILLQLRTNEANFQKSLIQNCIFLNQQYPGIFTEVNDKKYEEQLRMEGKTNDEIKSIQESGNRYLFKKDSNGEFVNPLANCPDIIKLVRKNPGEEVSIQDFPTANPVDAINKNDRPIITFPID